MKDLYGPPHEYLDESEAIPLDDEDFEWERPPVRELDFEEEQKVTELDNGLEFNNSSKQFTLHQLEKRMNAYLSKVNLGGKLKQKTLEAFVEVQEIQDSNLSSVEKAGKIKNILWSQRGPKTKLAIGGLIGTVFGLSIFGTGGIGIAALGSATGVWGFLAGTTGGVFVASIVQNLRNRKE